MGMSSEVCQKCKHPIIGDFMASSENRWMSEVVAIYEDGELRSGTFDGYLFNFFREDWADHNTYHRKCWEAIGKPTEYNGDNADHSNCQGGLFGCADCVECHNQGYPPQEGNSNCGGCEHNMPEDEDEDSEYCSDCYTPLDYTGVCDECGRENYD